jgi:hypothetical protein
MMTDSSNLKQISLWIRMCRESTGQYPPTLSALSNLGSLKALTSPRGAGLIDHNVDGPLRLWGREPYPGRARETQSWAEVDHGDYLYRPPVEPSPPHFVRLMTTCVFLTQSAEDPAPPHTVMLMTRPGLLWKNHVNVGYADGTVETVDYRTWTKRADIQSFLKACQALP